MCLGSYVRECIGLWLHMLGGGGGGWGGTDEELTSILGVHTEQIDPQRLVF